MIAAVVCLTVVIIVGLALMQRVVRHHRQALLDEQRLQALWLAESGVQRATARLAAAPDYTGETWQLTAAALHGPAAGVVQIRIEPVAGDTSRRRLIVEAHYPDDPLYRAIHRREILINLPSTGESS